MTVRNLYVIDPSESNGFKIPDRAGKAAPFVSFEAATRSVYIISIYTKISKDLEAFYDSHVFRGLPTSARELLTNLSILSGLSITFGGFSDF